MKAVVVALEGRFAAVLLEDGSIKKVINRQYTLGYEIKDFNALNKSLSLRFNFGVSYRLKVLASVAVLMVAFMGSSVWAYYTPYYSISLDVNPSIVLTANRFERIIDISAINADARTLLQDVSVMNQKAGVAVLGVLQGMERAGYLQESTDVFLATTGKSDEKSQKLANTLDQVAKRVLPPQIENIEREGGNVTTETIGIEMVKAAKAIGMTPGKYNIIVNKLGEDPVELQDVPTQELMKRVTENKGNPEAPGKNKENFTAPGLLKKPDFTPPGLLNKPNVPKGDDLEEDESIDQEISEDENDPGKGKPVKDENHPSNNNPGRGNGQKPGSGSKP